MQISDIKVGDVYYSVHVEQKLPPRTGQAPRNILTDAVQRRYVPVKYEILELPGLPTEVDNLTFSYVKVMFAGEAFPEMLPLNRDFMPTADEPDRWKQSPVTHLYKTLDEAKAWIGELEKLDQGKKPH